MKARSLVTSSVCSALRAAAPVTNARGPSLIEAYGRQKPLGLIGVRWRNGRAAARHGLQGPPPLAACRVLASIIECTCPWLALATAWAFTKVWKRRPEHGTLNEMDRIESWSKAAAVPQWRRRHGHACAPQNQANYLKSTTPAHTTRFTPCRSQPAMMASGLYSVCCQLGRAVKASMYALTRASCAGISQPRKYLVVTCGQWEGAAGQRQPAVMGLAGNAQCSTPCGADNAGTGCHAMAEHALCSTTARHTHLHVVQARPDGQVCRAWLLPTDEWAMLCCGKQGGAGVV